MPAYMCGCLVPALRIARMNAGGNRHRPSRAQGSVCVPLPCKHKTESQGPGSDVTGKRFTIAWPSYAWFTPTGAFKRGHIPMQHV